mgnify:CR=1 FL=1
MNTNKIKKISVKFPNFVNRDSIEYEGRKIVLKLPEIQNINNRMYSELFSSPSGMDVGEPTVYHSTVHLCIRGGEKSIQNNRKVWRNSSRVKKRPTSMGF